MVDQKLEIPRAIHVKSGNLVWALVALGLCLGFLAITLYLHDRTEVEYSFLYRDANAIAGNPFYYGILESLTAALLISSGSVLLFVAATECGPGTRPLGFSLAMGLLTVILGLDDLLMLHESAWFIHWRLEEVHIYLVYAALLVFSTVHHRRVFLSTPFPLLLAALAALGLAGMEDMLELGFGIEDYLEIVGFSFWFSYILATSLSLKRQETVSDRAAFASFRP